MRRRYGERGERAARAILAGVDVDVNEFPLSEDFVERAIVTIVHSEHARNLVGQYAPGAPVEIVPMGVPLPALVDRSIAREALRLPQSAFVIASITHVNPNKRIPVVMRALRRLVARLPEALFVVAGSVSPGIELARQVSLLNLERHVRLLGYVSDDRARLLARAADVCVNLRYPSAGETSASLLRLLGAGRPVLVTDDPSMAEYPRDAVLPVPVDRFEDETVAGLLGLLADSDELRIAAGQAARSFIERRHTLQITVEGYQSVIRDAFGVDLPIPDAIELNEPEPARPANPAPVAYSVLDAALADALSGLRMAAHDATIRRAARAATELRLDRLPVDENGHRRDE
jgi:glycosyltransferase involved in cell wall biosynthesis